MVGWEVEGGSFYVPGGPQTNQKPCFCYLWFLVPLVGFVEDFPILALVWPKEEGFGRGSRGFWWFCSGSLCLPISDGHLAKPKI